MVSFFFPDNLVPKENRVKVGDEKPVLDVLKISEIPSMPESRKEFLHNNNQLNSRKHSSRKNDLTNHIENLSNKSKHPQEKRKHNNSTKNLSSFENLEVDINGDKRSGSERSSPIEMMQLLTNRLSFPVANLNRQLPKTSGVCTQSSSTSGPSRIAVSSQTERILTKSLLSTDPTRHVTSRHPQQSLQLPAVSSVAVTTSAQSTTTYSDPRMEVRNIAPLEVRNSSGWDEDLG